MARSDPTRSDYCATRHLLRHFRHARELRRNPLAHDALGSREGDVALGTFAWRVYDALRALDARPFSRAWQQAHHTAILLRVDVQRHDPVQVAADLGLSTRQFHRERRVAHERFADAYRATLSAPVPKVACTVPRLLTERAAALADSGEVLSAISLLDDVASNAEPVDRCEALIRRAEIEAWSHRLDHARRYARDARSLLATISPESGTYTQLRDGYAAIELLLQWFALGPAAVARIDGASDRLPPAEGPRALVVLAAAALRNGSSSDALRLLDRLRIFGTAAPAAVVADALTLQAEIADFVGEDESVSETIFAKAAAAAEMNGLRGRALYATHQLASTRWMHTRSPLDRNAYRGLVDGIDRTLPPRLRSYLIFSAADIEVAIGHPRRALQAARTAATVSTNHYESFSAQGLEAGALLRMGRIGDAGTRAAQAADSARKQGHTRILSLTQRIQAVAQLARGDRRAAFAAIDEAIECAKRFSSTHVLAQAKTLRDRIVRN